MQVTHTDDHVTHAVVTAHETLNMGISDSAEFFHILSSTLYTNQRLAVVRETICNAWDAHVASGCTDKPIHITLKNGEFIIQDFGSGIPKELIQPIYGVYGASTKKNDGKQTGGFGLGCKAPFSYVEHFEVTSCHAGVKTIYMMSKSSGQVSGKPGITPILSIPTTESGITVKIKIQSGDFSVFHQLIKEVLRNGEMNALFNESIAEVVKYSECAEGYLLTPDTPLNGVINNFIYVRYGNVIYPLNSYSAFSDMYEEVGKVIQRVRGGEAYWKRNKGYDTANTRMLYLILLAPPDSIAVTPSRESLSYQDHTVATVKALLSNFINKTNVQKHPYVKQALLEAVEKKHSTNLNELLNPQINLNYFKESVRGDINNTHTFIKNILAFEFPSGKGITRKILFKRLDYLVAAKVCTRGEMQRWVKQWILENANTRKSYQFDKTPWLQRHIILPLVRKFSEYPELSKDNFYALDNKAENSWSRNYYIVPALTLKHSQFINSLPYLNKLVIIVRTQKEISRYLIGGKHIHKDLYGYSLSGVLIYNTRGLAKQIVAANKFFKEQGYTVWDITESQVKKKSYSSSYVADDDEAVERKAAKRGLPTLRSTLSSYGGIAMSNPYTESVERVTKPEAVILITEATAKDLHNAPHLLNVKFHRMFAEKHGDKVGIAKTRVQYDAYIAKGAWDFYDYSRHIICDEIMTNPRILEAHAYDAERLKIYPVDRSRCLDLAQIPQIIQDFGIVNNMTKNDYGWLEFWKAIAPKSDDTDRDVVVETKRRLANIALSPTMLALAKQVEESKLIHSVDLKDLIKVLSFPGYAGTPTAAKAYMMLQLILKD